MERFIKAMLTLLCRFLPTAFDETNMNRLHAGTVGLFVYKSADAIATVAASGYFNNYVDELKKDDAIIAIDTNLSTIDVLVVSSADNATPVTVVNGT